MTIEEAVLSLLTTNAGITALVGTPPRIYPQQAPQENAAAEIMYVAGDPSQLMTYTSYVNLFWARFRFDCYGGPNLSYSSAKAIAAAVRACLFGFLRGAVGNAINIQGIFDDGGEDGLEPPVHGGEHGEDYVGVQIRVCYNLIN